MIARITRNTLAVIFILLLACPAYGQKKKKPAKPVIDTNAIYHDKYHGVLLVGEGNETDTVTTVLQLDHKLYHDVGTFLLTETYKKPGGRILNSETPGTWTVLKGSADDVDATVVELDGDKVLFFLRWDDDSTLQKLSPTLEEMQPLELCILSSRVKPVPIKKYVPSQQEITMRKLSGRFSGKLPCADCNSIITTLNLRYKARGTSGDFTLTDKYIGTKSGDITNDRKGKWSYISKPAGTIIVLDNDKKGRETYYLVKKDGNLAPLDKSFQKIESPVDQTLKKQ